MAVNDKFQATSINYSGSQRITGSFGVPTICRIFTRFGGKWEELVGEAAPMLVGCVIRPAIIVTYPSAH
jgi:hypothetical protein